MNLRNEKPKKKRGRPPTTYQLTPKGFICATLLSNPTIGGEQLYNELEAWAKRQIADDKEATPALVFDGGGTIIGVVINED
jgi:predicted ArsR family transcriptional regulator